VLDIRSLGLCIATIVSVNITILNSPLSELEHIGGELGIVVNAMTSHKQDFLIYSSYFGPNNTENRA